MEERCVWWEERVSHLNLTVNLRNWNFLITLLFQFNGIARKFFLLQYELLCVHFFCVFGNYHHP